MSVCREAYRDYPMLEDVTDPPSSAKTVTGDLKPGYGCDGLLDRDTDYMCTVGGIVLHELIHWSALFVKTPGWNQFITPGAPGERWITDYKAMSPFDVPATGYKPYNAHMLNFKSMLYPNKFPPRVSVNNADSYHVYAASKYFQFRCGKQFRDPQTPLDGGRRADDVMWVAAADASWEAMIQQFPPSRKEAKQNSTLDDSRVRLTAIVEQQSVPSWAAANM
jgi:hypothetical protein